ncbi:hypothetical protein [Winogradskyella maritima]|uniref:Nitrite reductase/ring-hydroxylating ferredoxin subunit n=1 Tax=Winogradskyella maritima TaxID=1517766 RepID=A0ABV8AEP0_9FLAO
MKKVAFLLLSILFFGCAGDDRPNQCSFLLNVGVNFNVNLNLPQFNQLQFPVNAVRVEGPGNNGLILVAVNSGTIRAWDGSDPNHAPSSCSGLMINGLTATCGCPDGNEYELLSGQIVGNNPQPCTLREYRVTALGNNQFVVNN